MMGLDHATRHFFMSCALGILTGKKTERICAEYQEGEVKSE
jgi:hypothetical protein